MRSFSSSVLSRWKENSLAILFSLIIFSYSSRSFVFSVISIPTLIIFSSSGEIEVLFSLINETCQFIILIFPFFVFTNPSMFLNSLKSLFLILDNASKYAGFELDGMNLSIQSFPRRSSSEHSRVSKTFLFA